MTRHPRRYPDAKVARDTFAVLPHGRSKLGHELQHLASALDHVLAFGREAHLAGRAIQQPGAEFLFELRHRMADG